MRYRDHLKTLFNPNHRLEKLIMAVSAEVQGLLDLAKQENTLVASIDAGMKALQAQVAALQAQIANGVPSLSADDKAALAETATDIQNSITTLTADIPSNTTPTP